VDDADGLFWYANSDDPNYILRTGRNVALVAAVPLGLLFCAASRKPDVAGPAVFVLLVLIALAIAAGVLGAYVLDRGLVTRMRLWTPPGRPTILEVTRAGGRTAAYPLETVGRVALARVHEAGQPSYGRLTVVAVGRVERTRPGQPDLPSRWTEAFHSAGITVDVTDQYEPRPQLMPYSRTRLFGKKPPRMR
jgi:hypothetical protein